MVLETSATMAILQQQTTTKKKEKQESRQKDEVQKASKWGRPRLGEFC